MAQERRARRQAAVTRDALAGFERAIAAHPSEPSSGVEPEIHAAILAGMISMRDDLRTQLGRLEANLHGDGPYRPQEAVLKAMADPGVVTHVSFRTTFTLKAFEDHGDGSWTAFFREAGLLDAPAQGEE